MLESVTAIFYNDSQHKALIKHMDDHKQENAELKSIFEDFKKEIYKGTEQIRRGSRCS